MKNSDIRDPLFREAVEAIDAGNITTLVNLLRKHPYLVRDPLERPSGDYFNNPYLLWFVADNPIRVNSLPPNIVDITRLLIEFVKREAASTKRQQLDYALGLVATGRIPRECGVQIQMMDLLIDAGAKPGGGVGALAHGNFAAAKHLIKRGGEFTLAAAVGLEQMDDATRLVKHAGADEKLVALAVAAFYGNTQMIVLLLAAGANPNGYPKNGGFHTHATPLHQAVYSGNLEAVKLFVKAGAKLDARDKVYNGTPIGWAEYMRSEEAPDDEAKKRFAAIGEYLLGL